MTPNPMKMATPVRPSSCKPKPDITHSNETHMSNRTQLALLLEEVGALPASYALEAKEAA
ncbi:MAG: hypothetical protein INF55_17305 [Roseomonas sp.]|nr:hypothetical protein [Roseomonas sp.]